MVDIKPLILSKKKKEKEKKGKKILIKKNLCRCLSCSTFEMEKRKMLENNKKRLTNK